jgi:hypothetical protein
MSAKAKDSTNMLEMVRGNLCLVRIVTAGLRIYARMNEEPKYNSTLPDLYNVIKANIKIVQKI